MNKLSNIIKERRTARGWSIRELAEKANMSHTELNRIESGVRKNSSVPKLNALAEALGIPKNDMLIYAGYIPGTFGQNAGNAVTAVEKAFPGLKTEKQKQAAQKIIDIISFNDLSDDDLDMLVNQVEMVLTYIKNRRT